MVCVIVVIIYPSSLNSVSSFSLGDTGSWSVDQSGRRLWPLPSGRSLTSSFPVKSLTLGHPTSSHFQGGSQGGKNTRFGNSKNTFILLSHRVRVWLNVKSQFYNHWLSKCQKCYSIVANEKTWYLSDSYFLSMTYEGWFSFGFFLGGFFFLDYFQLENVEVFL